MHAPTLLIATLLLAGTADDLVTAKVDGLTLKVPAAWTHKVEDATYSYSAPSEDGAFELSVYTLPPRQARLCLDQLLEALGGEKGWDRITVGGEPAARKVAMDDSDAKKADFSTRTYLGCNGRLKWVLTFSHRDSKKARYQPLAEKIVQSVVYPPKPL
jgi:hypothetical protein